MDRGVFALEARDDTDPVGRDLGEDLVDAREHGGEHERALRAVAAAALEPLGRHADGGLKRPQDDVSLSEQ